MKSHPIRYHCIPIGDSEIHCAQSICWCHPIIKPVGESGETCTHNAKDCREVKERQTQRAASKGWIIIREDNRKDELLYALKSAIQRLETIHETHPSFHLEQDIKNLRLIVK